MSTFNRIITEERTCSASILYFGTLYDVILQWCQTLAVLCTFLIFTEG